MIINLKEKYKFILYKNSVRFISWVYHDFFFQRFVNKLVHDSQELKKNFKHLQPSLQKDSLGNPLCISCDLCIDACPEDALKLKKANLVNFPDSIQVGEAPMHFYLDTEKCTSCHLCAEVCAVEAIKLKRQYRDKKVDLVAISLEEKSHPEEASTDQDSLEAK